MAVQLKRQGVVNAASCSDSPLKPTSLAYGEPAIDSAGYLYIGDGSGKVVSRVRYADDCATSSTSDFASYANNSGALQGRKIGSGIWSSTTEFIPYVNKWGIMEVGKSIDFHEDENSSADWNIRLNSTNNSLKIQTTDYKFATVESGSIFIQNSGNVASLNFQTNNPSSKWSFGANSGKILLYNNLTSHQPLTITDSYITLNSDGKGDKNFLILNTAHSQGASIIFSQNGTKRIAIGEGTGTGVLGCFGIYNYEKMQAILYSDSNGYCHTVRMYNAVYNDYAELFPKGEETEPGDIIALDINSDNEQYIKATQSSKKVVGVHSNEYGHLIGGDEPPKGVDFEEYNFKKYIPVGLVGRCKVKVIGKVNKGDDIIPSEIPGVGRKWVEGIDSEQLLKNSVGFAVENSDDEDVKLIKVKLRG